MNLPKLRFKPDDGSEFPEWEEKKIGDFLNESRISGHTGKRAKKLTVKLWAKGIVPKESYLQGSEGTQYYVRHAGQLMYGKLDFLNCAFGIVPEELDGYESTIDSPAFDIHGILSDYLLAYITRKEFYKRNGDLANGTRKAKRIQPDVFFDMDINVPSLPEQKKIADFLSTIDEIITTTEAELTAWQERKKGVMQKIFNREVRFKADDGSEFPEWEERRIDSFSNCYAGATPSTKVAEYWNNGSIPWMSSGEVNNREIYETEKKISELGYEKSSTKMIKPNTVVIALAGQGKTRGMVAITRISVCTNQSLCAIETNVMVDDDYLYHYLITQYDNLRRISSGDGTRGGLNLQLVGEYKVFLPVLSEQKKIAECLSLLDDVINQIDTELLAWKEFKKGLLQQMFA